MGDALVATAFYRVLGKAVGSMAGVVPGVGTPLGAIGGAAAGLLGGGAGAGLFVHPDIFRPITAAELAYMEQAKTRTKEALAERFCLDPVGTWLSGSPGDETFGEWAIREGL